MTFNVLVVDPFALANNPEERNAIFANIIKQLEQEFPGITASHDSDSHKLTLSYEGEKFVYALRSDLDKDGIALELQENPDTYHAIIAAAMNLKGLAETNPDKWQEVLQTLQLAVRMGAGTDSIIMRDEAGNPIAEKNIKQVSNCPGINAPAAAHSVIEMLLYGTKHPRIQEMKQAVLNKETDANNLSHVYGVAIDNTSRGDKIGAPNNLSEKIAAITGAGNIGSIVIRELCKTCKQVRVSSESLNNLSDEEKAYLNKTYPNLVIYGRDDTSIFEGADIVSLHTPYRAGQSATLTQETLSKLNEGATVVNIGRGGLVDPGAMKEAIRNAKVGHFYSDVDIFFRGQDKEPDGPAAAYWELACDDNSKNSITLLPHGVSDAIVDVRQAMAVKALSISVRALAQEAHINNVYCADAAAVSSSEQPKEVESLAAEAKKNTSKNMSAVDPAFKMHKVGGEALTTTGAIRE